MINQREGDLIALSSCFSHKDRDCEPRGKFSLFGLTEPVVKSLQHTLEHGATLAIFTGTLCCSSWTCPGHFCRLHATTLQSIWV
ncbi:unnamed protein product [Protopolystoma xenopodis]|uniref:Uncharacterized protein n=1 Tax=Protopolystoma xenopodis TaxID=117903 RepID=A0A3S5B2I3_9PLAT|nr:unnamed protein product [Protopolystoma xenopodis]